MLSKKIRWIVLPVAVGAMAWSGWQMQSLMAADRLWGYLPMVFGVAFWVAVVSALLPVWTRHPENLRLAGLSLLSGGLLALGFPNSPLTPLMFVGFVPLLMVHDAIRKSDSRREHWQMFRYACMGLMAWNILTTWWICNAGFLAGLVANLLNTLLMCVPWLLFALVSKRLPSRWVGYAALIAFWMSFEFVHLRWDMSWPWLTLGNSFAQYPSWVQWYEWTGVPGGSLWILLANVLVHIALTDRRYIKWAATAIAVPLIVSVIVLKLYQPSGKPVEVVAVQPNYEPFYEKFDIPEYQQWERFRKLSVGALTSKTKFLVFPETSFSCGDEAKMSAHPNILTARMLLEDFPATALATGTDGHRMFKQDESTDGHDAVRTKMRGGQMARYEIYNSAALISATDSTQQVYHKSKLVPGPEILPFKNLLGFLQPIVAHLGGTMEGLGTQRERAAFSFEGYKVGPAICYESIYGEFCTGYIQKGAQAIFVMTNDGWWDDTPGYIQHRAFAALRAIETRREVVRSANTGSSCFVDQVGHIRQATAYNTEAAIRDTMLFRDGETFYVRYGDYLSRLANVVSLMMLLWLLVKRFRP